MIGGVRIEHNQGVVAHSDGDVVLHALADALLGATGLGDIGHFFPENDSAWADADSNILLAEVVTKVKRRGWHCINADCTVLCESPRIAPHGAQMREVIGLTLGCSRESVGVKATTMERMGFLGRGEGIGALAVVLLGGA